MGSLQRRRTHGPPLGYMFPRSALSDRLDARDGHAVSLGKHGEAFSGRSDGANVVFSNLGHVMLGAVAENRNPATFRVHVPNIVSLRPKPQMGRVAAKAIVANVEDYSSVVALPFRNGSMNRFPNCAMGKDLACTAPAVTDDAVTSDL